MGRLRWACEPLDQEGKANKLLPNIVVRRCNRLVDIERVDRDADIDVVILSIYWHRLADETLHPPLIDMCQDIVFHAG